MVKDKKIHADMIREALEFLGVARPKTIIDYITKKHPEIKVNEDSFRADLIAYSVNHTSNKHHSVMRQFLFFDREKKTYKIAETEPEKFVNENTDGSDMKHKVTESSNETAIKAKNSNKKITKFKQPRVCPKLKERTAEQIASFLIQKFNDDKILFDVADFEEKGFTKNSLSTDKNNFFKFLILVAYDRRPFWPFELVWDRNSESVNTVLDGKGIFELDKIKNLEQKELEKILIRSTVNRLHLNTDGANTNFARTIKEIAAKSESLRNLVLNSKSRYELINLHKELDDIHGYGPTISSKFIMYTIREMGMNDIPHLEFDVISSYLFQEYHNNEWAIKLNNEKKGLFEEVISNLHDDPMAVDYFFYLDRYYCKQDNCGGCNL